MSSTARPTLNFWVNAAPAAESASETAEGTKQRDRGQKEQARLQAGADPVVFLHVVLESAEQKRRAQHEQRVGDDRAGDGRLHQHVLPGAQRGQRDDQFGQVSQRGVEQAADRIARLGRHGFGGVTQQRGQRHDGQHGQHEKQRVRFGLELLGGEHHGHEGQQPEQRIVTDFFKQGVHGGSLGSESCREAARPMSVVGDKQTAGRLDGVTTRDLAAQQLARLITASSRAGRAIRGRADYSGLCEIRSATARSPFNFPWHRRLQNGPRPGIHVLPKAPAAFDCMARSPRSHAPMQNNRSVLLHGNLPRHQT